MMKKFGWTIAFIVGSVGGTLYYLVSQVTAIPAWYGESAIAANAISMSNPAALQQAKTVAAAKIANARSHPDGTQEIILDERSLNALAATEVSNLAEHTRLTEAVRSVNSTIRNGQIESGAVIDLSNIPVDRLDATEREALTLVRQTFPTLADREIYVGIEGKPRVTNGKLQFDDNLRIKIGNLSLTAVDLAEKLGVSPAELWQGLDRELGNLQVKDVQVSGNSIRLRGVI
jgi:hypothetical protein